MTEGGIKVSGVAVKNGNLDNAIKRWKQKLSRDGVPSEMRKREAYVKPGVKRRQAKQEGIKNARKNSRRER
ncbi:MAG TPA: 30S ribosomal protein S21 [Bacilli bacterium]|nr:30S ribosomal protein S21 [Bacilli bacterium]